MAKVGLLQLNDILKKNICIVRFTRRIPLSQTDTTRRMLCTNDYDILNSVNGRITLNYRPPKGPPKFNYSSKNLICVWDILMQDWRLISMDYCDLQEKIPSNEFWKYFNEKIRPMSTDEKIKFMI